MSHDRRSYEDTFGDSNRTWTFGEEQEAQPTAEYKVGLAEKPLKGQDRLLIMEEQGIFGIFDGMGGHGGPDAGAIASELASETFWQEYSGDDSLGRDIDK